MQLDLLAEIKQLQRLSELGDSLEKLEVVNFEIFRPVLDKAFRKDRKSNAGRPPYDTVMMFKVLVLQRLFNLSDDQTKYQVTDRISFQRFLGLSLGERVPDAKTIWLFRDMLTKNDTIRELFDLFNDTLSAKGIIIHSGTIVDTTFVDEPRQRNKRDENDRIKKGEIPEKWLESPNKLAQKDTDARWTKKNIENIYGYKDHVKTDTDTKLITDYSITPANVHDSNVFTDFLDEHDRVIYADAAYTGKEIPAHMENRVCKKGFRGKPLTEEQKQRNHEISKVRC